MTIRQATLEDMPFVADVHVQCFPKDEHYTTLMGGGDNLTQKMYEAYLREENLFLVAEDKNKIIGFCMGYMYGSNAMDSFYRDNVGKLFKRTLTLLLHGHPLAWKKVWGIMKQLIRRILKKPLHNAIQLTIDRNAPTASLLSIGVLESYRGKGVSTHLFEAYGNLLQSKGVKAFTLSTWVTNNRGIAFYHKVGMRVRQQIDDEIEFIKDLV